MEVTTLEKRVIESLEDRSPQTKADIKKDLRDVTLGDVIKAVTSLTQKRIVTTGEDPSTVVLTTEFKQGTQDGFGGIEAKSRNKGYLWGYYLASAPVFTSSGIGVEGVF